MRNQTRCNRNVSVVFAYLWSTTLTGSCASPRLIHHIIILTMLMNHHMHALRFAVALTAFHYLGMTVEESYGDNHRVTASSLPPGWLSVGIRQPLYSFSFRVSHCH